MNCQDALDLLYDIIDREASEIDARRVKEHLESCRDCFEVYRLEQSVQDFINEKVKSPEPANPKAEQLKSKILSQLDEIDRENPDRREPRFFSLSARTLAAAASLVVLIGAGLFLASLMRHSDIYIPLERAHWAAAESLDTYRDDQTTAALLAGIQSEYDYQVSPAVAGFALVGGNAEEIMGVEMGHLVYHNDDRIISVFFAPADQFEISSDLEKSKVVRNNLEFFDHNCRGCRLVYHRIGDLVVVTASTDRDVELLDFVPGLSAI
jgi:anti-sigma factor (TIGR02949 family)